MFFPDKMAGLREAFRVLKPGGRYLFNTWDSFEHNSIARITHETIGSFFAADPPQFYRIPFSLHDPAAVCEWLGGAGFTNVEYEAVAKTGVSPTAADVARGLIDGNPVYGVIMERRPEALEDIKRAVASRIAAELGDHPVRAHLRALVFSATRP
jgi:hypothetical protein